MFLGDSPIFSMMKERMHWLSDRQRVIAENVSNADTPNYIAKDLSEPDFGAMLRSRSSRPVLTATRTDGDHMSSNRSTVGSTAAIVRSPDFDTTPTGNFSQIEGTN